MPHITDHLILIRDVSGRLFNPECVNQKPVYGANLNVLFKDFNLKPKKNREKKK